MIESVNSFVRCKLLKLFIYAAHLYLNINECIYAYVYKLKLNGVWMYGMACSTYYCCYGNQSIKCMLLTLILY